MLIYKASGKVWHSQNLTFSIQFFIKISMCFWDPSLDLNFSICWTTWCQKARFWTPLASSLVPNLCPKSHKLHQKAQKSIPRIAKSIPGIDVVANSRSRALFWSILDGFLMILDDFWHQFSSMFDTFLATKLQTTDAADHETLYSKTFKSQNARPRTSKNQQEPPRTNTKPGTQTKLKNTNHKTTFRIHFWWHLCGPPKPQIWPC